MAFWDNRITGDRASHARSGVGPATDYGADIGDPIHAPFAGRTRTYDTVDGGYGVIITAPDGTEAVMQHLNKRITPKDAAHREIIGEAGNTGKSTGPHVHAWVKFRGERIAFEEWLNWHVRGKSATPPANAVPASVPRVRINENWFVYGTEHDAYWGQRNVGLVGPHKDGYVITDFGNDGKPVQIEVPGRGRVWIGSRYTAAPRA